MRLILGQRQDLSLGVSDQLLLVDEAHECLRGAVQASQIGQLAIICRFRVGQGL